MRAKHPSFSSLRIGGGRTALAPEMATPPPAAAEPSNPSPASETDAEKELALDRMLTRLAFADDARLPALLALVLPYAISALASSSPSLRKLVMEILSHINKRVKHRQEITLPMMELWKIYTEVDSTPMVRNFCIVYLEMAFERLTSEDKEMIAPLLLVNVSNFPVQHQGVLLRLVSKAVGECHSQKVSDSTAAKYASIRGTKDGELFVEFSFHVLLYQLPLAGVTSQAGLSLAQSDRITGKQPLTGDILTSRKLGVLNIIEAMELKSELSYPLFLVAASDSQESVSKLGEELLKRKASDANLDDPVLVRTLFMLFNGSVGVENVAADLRVAPVGHSIRARLLSVFTRSITAANSFPSTLQCIFGSIYGAGTTYRLKQLGMEFTVWVLKHAADNQLKLMGPLILGAIVRFLDSSSTNITDPASKSIMAFAYQAIGQLSSRMPNLFRDKIDMAVRLFTALKVEDQSLSLSIQEALNSLAVAYKDATPEVLRSILELLMENCQADQSEVRFCSVRWSTMLYSLKHSPSRYICMLAASDPKLDIREIALLGLHLTNDHGKLSPTTENHEYPDFNEMLDFIASKQPLLLQPCTQREGKLLFQPKTFLTMITFLMKCFGAQFSSSITEVANLVSTSTERMCTVLEHAMAHEGSNELHAAALKSLIDVATCHPKLVALRYADRLHWLKELLVHIDSDTREAASRLLGIACSEVSDSVKSDLLSDLLSFVRDGQVKRFQKFHGVLCAVGYITSECMNNKSIPMELYESVINALAKVVESESAALASIAMESLGHIGLRCQLPMIILNSTTGGVLTVMFDRLTKLLTESDVKAVQKIVISIGHISWTETSSDNLSSALKLIFSLSRSKIEDILFAAGEALSFVWGEVPVTADIILKSNYASLSQATNYLTSDITLSTKDVSPISYANEEARSLAQEVILSNLFDNLLFSSRKEERCSGTVWLVSLTMYCGHHQKIQQKLPEIQDAFTHLLGDSNELTQDLASQGMSIVFELGDPSVKQELLNALVSTLTGSKKRKKAIKLMDESEVFQEGTIGENLSGGKLSTYKELCSLANEMGQPDLIYKFMDLANYQAALNSKRGAAFGFSRIAAQAGDALQPQLKILIPKLLRYQYDPDKNVQDSMTHIWKSIVPDSKKTIDEYFDAIMDDLVVQSGSRLWRSREASSLALADIIQGRRYDQICQHLKKVWVAAFRTMDDIKETVRNAGESLCRAVTSLTIRLCDISLTATSDANRTISIVLPYLLEEGIASKVSSIQKASISVVMKIAKGAGVALRPYLSELICCMLESLSSLEDQRLNYVEMHAENVGIQTNKLENLRIAVAKDSPMWETLDLCLNVVNTQSLELLVPHLLQVIKSGVGLNTRVGVANFTTLLVQRITTEIKPYSSLLLKHLFRAVLEEKSTAAKRAFASSCAVVLKYANSPDAQKLIGDTTSLLLGDKNSQLSGALLLKAYLNLAADVLSGYSALVFPIIFVSRFDDETDIRTMFDQLWEEIPSSENVTLQFYITEINHLLCECLESSSWSSKRKAAKAITKLSDTLGSSLSSCYHALLQSLLKELPGRYWEGKVSVLNAVTSLCLSCHDAIVKDGPATPAAIIGAISTACAKKVKTYREEAFSCLQQVIRAFDDPEFFRTVFPMLYDICARESTSNTNGTVSVNPSGIADEDESEVSSPPLDKVVNCVASCIHVADLREIINQKDRIFLVIQSAFSVQYSWQVKLSAVSTVREICSKLSVSVRPTFSSSDVTPFVQELIVTVSPKLIECMKSIKIAQVHISVSEALLDLTERLKEYLPTTGQYGDLRIELAELYNSEKNEQAKTLLRKSLHILEGLDGGDITMT